MIMHPVHVALLHDRSRLLTALRAVDDHGSVVAAAEALGFTPSAISQQVKRLERQTNVPLLERVGRGVMLTREGRHLVDAGSRLLADLETIESGLHQQAGTVAGHLRIIAFSTAMRGLVAPRVRALRDAHPDLVLALTEREPWDTVELVATGQADVGVAHSWGDVTLAIPDHLETTSLADDVADVIVPAGHRLAGAAGDAPTTWSTRAGSPPRRARSVASGSPGCTSAPVGSPGSPTSPGVPVAPGAGRGRTGHRAGARLGREELGAGLVAVRAHDPVPTRNIVAVHRRSMSESPAVRAVVAALSG